MQPKGIGDKISLRGPNSMKEGRVVLGPGTRNKTEKAAPPNSGFVNYEASTLFKICNSLC